MPVELRKSKANEVFVLELACGILGLFRCPFGVLLRRQRQPRLGKSCFISGAVGNREQILFMQSNCAPATGPDFL